MENELGSEKTTRKEYRKGLQERTTGKDYRKELQERGTAKRILDLCQDNPFVTIPEIAASLELTEDGVNYHLSKLRKHNRIARIGGRKFGQWEVKSGEDE